MDKIARIVLQTYLFEKKVLKPEEIPEAKLLPNQKIPLFITVSDGETVVASSGRVYALHPVAEEIIELTTMIPSDPRFVSYKENPEKARKLNYRVDLLHDADRRILHHPDEIDSKTEGMIVVCQKQEKLGVLLPRMLPGTPSGEEIYHHIAQKIQLDTHTLGKWDLILYAIKTETFEDKVG